MSNSHQSEPYFFGDTSKSNSNPSFAQHYPHPIRRPPPLPLPPAPPTNVGSVLPTVAASGTQTINNRVPLTAPIQRQTSFTLGGNFSNTVHGEHSSSSSNVFLATSSALAARRNVSTLSVPLGNDNNSSHLNMSSSMTMEVNRAPSIPNESTSTTATTSLESKINEGAAGPSTTNAPPLGGGSAGAVFMSAPSPPPPPHHQQQQQQQQHVQTRTTRQQQAVIRSAAFLFMLLILALLGGLRTGLDGGESESAKKAAAGSAPTTALSSSDGDNAVSLFKSTLGGLMRYLKNPKRAGGGDGQWWWDEDAVPQSAEEEILDRWADRRRRDVEELAEKSAMAAEDEGNRGDAGEDNKKRAAALLFKNSWHVFPNASEQSVLSHQQHQTTISKAQEASLRRFMLQQYKASLPLRRRHWVDYETYQPIGFGGSGDRKAGEEEEVVSSEDARVTKTTTRPTKRSLPWKKVFIAANLFNNEDMIGDYMASMTTFIERGLLGRRRSKLDAEEGKDGASDGEEDDARHSGDWFDAKDIFVSIYSNANSDSTPYLLEHLVHPQLSKINVRHHIVPQGAPSCSGIRSGNKKTSSGISTMDFGFGGDGEDLGRGANQEGGGGRDHRFGMRYYDKTRKKPRSISRIEWLGCLRNHALLPLYVHGKEGLFGDRAFDEGDEKQPPGGASFYSSSSSSSSFFDNLESEKDLHPAFLKWLSAQKQREEEANQHRQGQPSDDELFRTPTITAERGTSLVDYDAFIHEWFQSQYSRAESERFRQAYLWRENNGKNQRNSDASDAKDDKKRQQQEPPIALCNHSFGLTGYLQQPYQNWWDPHSFAFKQHLAKYAQTVSASGAGASSSSPTPYCPMGLRSSGGGEDQQNGEGNTADDNGDDDDDVLVLFFNDVYFYPWQISYLLATNTPIATTTTKTAAKHSSDDHKAMDAKQTSSSSASASALASAPSFDMACALDYYMNLYDTWVLRSLDGQPFTAYGPYVAVEEGGVGPLTDVRPILEWQRRRGGGGGGGKGNASSSSSSLAFGAPLEADAAATMLTGPTLVTDILGYNGYYSRLKDAVSRTAADATVRSILSEMTEWVVKGTASKKKEERARQKSSDQIVLPALPVRSCWNGVVAIRGGLFLKEGLRFRFQTKEELMYQQCWESECKYIGQDMATINMIKAMEAGERRKRRRRATDSQSSLATHPSSSFFSASSSSSSSSLISSESLVVSPARIVVNPLVQISYDMPFFAFYQGEEEVTATEPLGGLGRPMTEETVFETMSGSRFKIPKAPHPRAVFPWAKDFALPLPLPTAAGNDDESVSVTDPNRAPFTFTGDTADTDAGTFSYTIVQFVPSSASWWQTPIRRLFHHFISSGAYYSAQYWLKVGSWLQGMAVPMAPPNPRHHQRGDNNAFSHADDFGGEANAEDAALPPLRGSASSKIKKGTDAEKNDGSRAVSVVEAVSAPSPTTAEILSVILQIALNALGAEVTAPSPADGNVVSSSFFKSSSNASDFQNTMITNVLMGIAPAQQLPIPQHLEKFIVMEDPIVTGGQLRPVKDPRDDDIAPLIPQQDRKLYKALFGASAQSGFIGQWWWHHFKQARLWLEEADRSRTSPKKKGEEGHLTSAVFYLKPLLRRASALLSPRADVEAKYGSSSSSSSTMASSSKAVRFRQSFFSAVRILLTLKAQYGFDLETTLESSFGVVSPPPKSLKILRRSLRSNSPIASALDPRFMFCVDATDTMSLAAFLGKGVDVLCLVLLVSLIWLVRRHAREHHYYKDNAHHHNALDNHHHHHHDHPQHFSARHLVDSARAAAGHISDAVQHPSLLFGSQRKQQQEDAETANNDGTSTSPNGPKSPFAITIPSTPLTSPNTGTAAAPSTFTAALNKRNANDRTKSSCSSPSPFARYLSLAFYQKLWAAGTAALKELLLAMPVAVCLRPLALRVNTSSAGGKGADQCFSKILRHAMKDTNKEDGKMV